MLQLSLLRAEPERVKERLLHKGFRDTHLVDELISLDEERRALTFRFDDTKARVNAASREIGNLMKSGQKGEAEAKKRESEAARASLAPIEADLARVEAELQEKLLRLPNLPHASVPAGRTPEENEVVRSGGTPAEKGTRIPHWDLARKHDLIDFELGNKITGAGFPVYKGRGARLQRALIQYFLDYNTAAGYTECQVPHLVNAASGFGTGQLPDKEGQMYHVGIDDLYLIPTAEVPLTNLFRDTVSKTSDLPIRLTGYTPCFRREAGSYGKDVRGLNRLHQFDKVEVVQLVASERSYEVLEEMVSHVETLVQSLELPYRILRLCGGDMGFTAALTYDFEVWSAAQERWLEVSSVSNFESYQTARLKARYKDESGKNALLHSLNGSSLALPRILAALLENGQDENGIRLPRALQPYFGSEMI